MLSLKSSKPQPCFVATGEVIAEAADEETAGTAAPAISAADYKDAHHILTSAEESAAAGAGAGQLKNVAEGDGEAGLEGGSSCNGGKAIGKEGGERVGSSNGLRGGAKVPKCPPMMSRSAYLQVRGAAPTVVHVTAH
jgi:hypothetical protein